MKIAPSVLASDLADIQSGLRLMEQTGCDMVHWDVMDGHFVPNLTFGPGTIRWGRNHCDLPFDVHLMVTDPMMYLPLLTDVGVEMVSFQIEVTNFAPRLISLMRELGFRPSVAINPQTSLVAVEEILDLMRHRLAASGFPAEVAQHLVLTGGGSQLTGLVELASNMFGRPARLGRPRAMTGLPPAAAAPDFSAAIGLLLHWARGDEKPGTQSGQRFLRTGTGYFARVGEWIMENF